MTSATLPAGTTDAVIRRVFPQRAPFADDPVGWVDARLRERLWSKQREIARSVVEHPQTVVPSCHAAGKSYLAARIAAWWLDTHPVGDAFVVTSAPTQNQVRTILWREIDRAHRAGRLGGQITLGNVPEWKITGQVVAFGRKTADQLDESQAMASFQGIHARYLLVILDEAAGVPGWLYDAAFTLATGPDDRILAIGNPDDPTSRFAETCKPGSGWNVIPIPASSTPKFTGEPIDERIPLVSPEWVDRVRREWGEDSPRFQARVHALFPDVSDDTLFPPRLIQLMQRTDLPGTARGGYGADIARYGDAETVVYRNRGGVIRLVNAWRQQDTETTADALAGLVIGRHGERSPVPIAVDGDGLGAGVVDKLQRRRVPVIEFRGGQAPHDTERFANRRAEVFWTLRQDAEAGLIDIEPQDELLAAQLGKLKWKLDSRGRILLESKEDMARRGVKSPDRADAVAMAYSTPTVSPIPTVERKPTPSQLEGVLDDVASLRTGESLTGDLLEARF